MNIHSTLNDVRCASEDTLLNRPCFSFRLSKDIARDRSVYVLSYWMSSPEKCVRIISRVFFYEKQNVSHHPNI